MDHARPAGIPGLAARPCAEPEAEARETGQGRGGPGPPGGPERGYFALPYSRSRYAGLNFPLRRSSAIASAARSPAGP